jgi:hypothetical protein
MRPRPKDNLTARIVDATYWITVGMFVGFLAGGGLLLINQMPPYFAVGGIFVGGFLGFLTSRLLGFLDSRKNSGTPIRILPIIYLASTGSLIGLTVGTILMFILGSALFLLYGVSVGGILGFLTSLLMAFQDSRKNK